MRNAQAALLVFDLTRPETFENVPKWASVLRDVSSDCEVALVGNKCDLADGRETSFARGEATQREIEAEFYIETSAASGEGTANLLRIFLESPRLRAQVAVELTPPVDVAVEQRDTWGGCVPAWDCS
jgi:GTPase SAR1 family protein